MSGRVYIYRDNFSRETLSWGKSFYLFPAIYHLLLTVKKGEKCYGNAVSLEHFRNTTNLLPINKFIWNSRKKFASDDPTGKIWILKHTATPDHASLCWTGNEWVDACVRQWLDEWMNEWMNEWTRVLSSVTKIYTPGMYPAVKKKKEKKITF